MIRKFIGAVASRILGTTGLASGAELERTRRALRSERERTSRVEAAAAAKLEAVNAKLQSVRERAKTEHTAHRTTLELLRRYLMRLERMETEVAGRLALERRVRRSQLTMAARAARRRGLSEEAAARARRFAELSCEYRSAVSRWRDGSLPAEVTRRSVVGLRWSALAADAGTPSSGKHAAERWLPMHDLGIIRQFAAGGVMLDIGAGVGAAAIPRVLLGDFSEAYAAEADPDHYLCLVGNTLDNNLEGRVLPDGVAVGGPVTLDDWLQHHAIDVDAVRFVRVALQEWNRNVLAGAASLLKRRHVVWQLEVSTSQLADESTLKPLARDIAAHFSNVKELGQLWADPWIPAAGAADLLRRLAREHRDANLLLFNLPTADARVRRTAAPDDGRNGDSRTVISLLHATARLPDGWKPAMEAFRARAKNPGGIEYILAVNHDISYALPAGEMRGWGRYALVNEGVTGTNSAYNAAAKVSRGDILVTIADDYYPPEGWDEQIRAAIPDVTEEIVLDVENSDGVARLLPFSFLTRSYYERYGYIFYPGYHGFFGDNEFTEQARRDGVIRRARHIVFEHRHPDRGTAPMDEIYARQRSHFEEGKRLFRERKAKGFPPWPD